MWRFRAWLAAGITLIAAGGAVGLAPSGRAAHAATANVAVQDDQFGDGTSGTLTTTINVGDTVLWTWSGSNPHSVTADDGSFDEPTGGFKTSGTFSFTFNAPGTYAYYCRVHGGPGGAGMHGVIVVQAAATSTPTSTSTPVSATPTRTNTPAGSTTAAASATTTPAPTPTSATTAAPPTVAASAMEAAVIAPAPAGGAAGAAGAQLPATGSSGYGGGTDARWLAIALVVAGGGVVAGTIALRRRMRRR